MIRKNKKSFYYTEKNYNFPINIIFSLKIEKCNFFFYKIEENLENSIIFFHSIQ